MVQTRAMAARQAAAPVVVAEPVVVAVAAPVDSIAKQALTKLSNFFAAFRDAIYSGCSKIKQGSLSATTSAKSLAGRVSTSITENATLAYNKVRGIFVRTA